MEDLKKTFGLMIAILTFSLASVAVFVWLWSGESRALLGVLPFVVWWVICK